MILHWLLDLKKQTEISVCIQIQNKHFLDNWEVWLRLSCRSLEIMVLLWHRMSLFSVSIQGWHVMMFAIYKESARKGLIFKGRGSMLHTWIPILPSQAMNMTLGKSFLPSLPLLRFSETWQTPSIVAGILYHTKPSCTQHFSLPGIFCVSWHLTVHSPMR